MSNKLTLEQEAKNKFELAKTEWEKGTDTTPAYFLQIFTHEGNDGCFDDRQELAACFEDLEKLIEAQAWSAEERAAVLERFKAVKEQADAAKAAALAKRNVERYEVSYYNENLFDEERDAGIKPIPTGFKQLDSFLEGGLVDSLYVFGGVPSVGKTDWLLQMADQMSKAENAKARAEHDFLYFSLEMRRKELFARSISRYSLARSVELYGCNNFAKLAGQVLERLSDAGFMANPNFAEKHLEVLQASRRAYADDVRGRLFVHAGKHYTIDEIRKDVREHQDGIRWERTPVIFVDHMQILRPHKDFITDKQNVDYIITELKQISNDFNSPVIAVSILNRESQKNGGSEQGKRLSMAAFKESGLIEYSADGCWGMVELSDNGNKGTSLLRNVELQLIKNRQGNKDEKAAFCYQPAFHTFTEQKTED